MGGPRKGCVFIALLTNGGISGESKSTFMDSHRPITFVFVACDTRLRHFFSGFTFYAKSKTDSLLFMSGDVEVRTISYVGISPMV